MANGNGHLLLTIEGLETSHIPEKEREKAVLDFYNMKSEAEYHDDCFYALTDVYSHIFSYGTFYPNFYHMSWNDFQACESLKGISQRVFALMQGFCQCPDIRTLESETAFKEKGELRTHTGYSNPKPFPDFVGNKKEWETWHREWNTYHTADIDWSTAINDWFPRQELILQILKRELFDKFKEQHDDNEAKKMLSEIADERIVHEFHDKVMRHKGHEIAGYASKIGGEICTCNYYVYEKALSDMESQQAQSSMREIYSIINRFGKQQFLSIDLKHGMFESHDENGVHQGELRFDGSYNTDKDVTHSLKCIEQWRKKNRK